MKIFKSIYYLFCEQVGDSIMRKSRETLERAIHLVENNKQWAAKVVYGDTDR